MKIFLAGGNNKNVIVFCEKYGVHRLYSFYNEQWYIKKWNSDKSLLMVDSGAHSYNKVDLIYSTATKYRKKLKPLEEYIKEYYDYLSTAPTEHIYVELDVYTRIQEEEVSHWNKLVRKKNKGIKIMRVYHTILDNGSLEVLKKWIKEGEDYIGLASDSHPYFDKIFSITRDKIKVHGFALNHNKYLHRYPFYSVDSTSPIATVVYGIVFVDKLKMLHKRKLVREKRRELFIDKITNIEKAVYFTKLREEYYTELWRKRGVKWDE
jgi:hypothetical protein